jgi:hypothetical protein
MISISLKFNTEQGKYWYHEVINKHQVKSEYLKSLMVELANYKFPAVSKDS